MCTFGTMKVLTNAFKEPGRNMCLPGLQCSQVPVRQYNHPRLVASRCIPSVVVAPNSNACTLGVSRVCVFSLAPIPGTRSQLTERGRHRRERQINHMAACQRLFEHFPDTQCLAAFQLGLRGRLEYPRASTSVQHERECVSVLSQYSPQKTRQANLDKCHDKRKATSCRVAKSPITLYLEL